jgi:hypothetical protein
MPAAAPGDPESSAAISSIMFITLTTVRRACDGALVPRSARRSDEAKSQATPQLPGTFS